MNPQIQTHISKLRQTQTRTTSLPKIDAILIINLDRRQDRWTNVQKTSTLLEKLTSNIVRISATECDPGSKGCALSHIKALRYAQLKDFQHIMVLEDDAMLDIEPAEFVERVCTTLQEIGSTYDCIICGSENNPPTIEDGVVYRKLKTSQTNVQTTVAYIIHNSYIPILTHLWQYCADHLVPNLDAKKYFIYAIDQQWKLLFPQHNWYWLEGNLIRQRPDYSDIMKDYVKYAQPLRLQDDRRRELHLL